jgi:hypothetical protein
MTITLSDNARKHALVSVMRIAMKRRTAIAFAALSLLLRAPFAAAQAPRYLAVDAAIGAARGRGGDFIDRLAPATRIAASGVVPLTPRLGLFAALGYDWTWFSAAHGDVCRLDPDNPGAGCLPRFPAVSGANVTFGGVLAPVRLVELRAGLGAGAYRIDDTETGALLAQAEATMYPMRDVGIVATARTVAIPRSRVDRLGITQWSLGVRLRRSASRP